MSEKRRILVTAISGDVSNGILKTLLNTDNEVFGCDIYDYPVGMDKCISYWKSDLAVHPLYIDNLLKKCAELKIGYIIPVNEIEIKVISENLQKFENAGIKVMLQRPNLISVFQDKYKTARFLGAIPQKDERSKFTVPYTYFYNEFIEDGEEYIVKLNNSSGSKLMARIRQKAELDEFLKANRIAEHDIVVQRFIEGDDQEYTTGVFSDGETVSTMSFKRKIKNGYTNFVELVREQQLQAVAENIARYIDLRGYINIQSRRLNGQFYIFEINARVSGSVYFQYMLGYDVVNWWLDLLDGKKFAGFIPKYQKAIGMRELTEKYVILEEAK